VWPLALTMPATTQLFAGTPPSGATDNTVLTDASLVWSVPMTAGTLSDGNNPNLGFGIDTVSTDGLDANDVASPPPASSGKFDAYFAIVDDFFPKLNTDMRGPGATVVWTLVIAGTSTQSRVVSWNASAVPSNILLTLARSGAVDTNMKTTNNLTLPVGSYTLTIAARVIVPPTVATMYATNITGSSARLGGTLTSLGTATSANVSFQWGTSSGSYTNETIPVSMNTVGTFSANISGLNPSTSYYFRARATADNMTAYGTELSLRTVKALWSIVIAPANSSVPVGKTVQFRATGAYSDNSSENITNSVTWMTDNTSIATIGAHTGLVQGLSLGQTKITATLGTVSNNTMLNVAPYTWLVPMTASTLTSGSNPSLVFGTSINATDSFDSGIDIPHPPIPEPKFDAYFEIIHDVFPQLDKDSRAPSERLKWMLKVTSQTENITITWNASAVPAELSAYMNTGTSTIDMKSQNSTLLSPGTYSLLISVSTDRAVVIPLKAGWNMVSLPVVSDNTTVKSVFPAALIAYSWNPLTKSFDAVTNIETGKSYWVAVLSDTAVTVVGAPILTWSINITTGWNMVGSIFGTAGFTTPEDNPDGSVMALTYWWNPVTKSYVYGTTIDAGKGYWVAATGECTLTLSTASK